MAKNRLTPDAWIKAGFRALSSNGPAALKAEPLARALGTTKGSFYWHFDDVPAFHAAMLDLWEARTAQDVAEAADHEPNPIKRLRALGTAVTHRSPEAVGSDRAEAAIRAWALENEMIAAALARVDKLRMDHIADTLSDIGVTNPEISRILYGAFIGMRDLSAKDGADNSEAMGTLVDLILALYEES